VLATLRADGLTLRPLQERDVDRLVGVIAQPGVREWWVSFAEPEYARADLRNDGAAFAIEVDGALAGWVGFDEHLDPNYRRAGLDIFLAPAFQRRGFGRRALWLAARWLLEVRGHHRLTIDPACHNARAIRAYTAVGFRPVGMMRAYERGVDGTWHDNLLMDLLRDELPKAAR
jgi:aminoglycoside 6'-N-acetyltransferase